ncbi:hypothetical protein DZA50_01140 [Kangiella sp. HD9-110m-PIT-SAG07]|nr:hypothetical protein DZA50_01140 [Kangiella sp. HD9-110m-PIT-SAG07]
MYKVFVFIICYLAVTNLFATQIEEKDLTELVTLSDVIIEADVVDVYGKDKFDAIVRNPEMEIGPGLENDIVLYVCSNEVLLNSINIELPKCFETSIWNKWHLSLEGLLEYQSKSVILLLKGKNLERVYPGYYIWPMENKGEIIDLIKKRDTVK